MGGLKKQRVGCYLMDQGPGVLLSDGGGEHFEDLVKVQTVVRIQVARVPHLLLTLVTWDVLECVCTGSAHVLDQDGQW